MISAFVVQQFGTRLERRQGRLKPFGVQKQQGWWVESDGNGGAVQFSRLFLKLGEQRCMAPVNAVEIPNRDGAAAVFVGRSFAKVNGERGHAPSRT